MAHAHTDPRPPAEAPTAGAPSPLPSGFCPILLRAGGKVASRRGARFRPMVHLHSSVTAAAQLHRSGRTRFAQHERSSSQGLASRPADLCRAPECELTQGCLAEVGMRPTGVGALGAAMAGSGHPQSKGLPCSSLSWTPAPLPQTATPSSRPTRRRSAPSPAAAPFAACRPDRFRASRRAARMEARGGRRRLPRLTWVRPLRTKAEATDERRTVEPPLPRLIGGHAGARTARQVTRTELLRAGITGVGAPLFPGLRHG